MSATSFKSSPTSAPASAEPVGFEGWDDIVRSWRDGLRPDPDLTVSGWADRHRVLSSRAAAEPGRYRTARTPYMRAVMDALSTGHPAQRVVLMKAAQVGATEAITRPARCWPCSRRSSWQSATRASASMR